MAKAKETKDKPVITKSIVQCKPLDEKYGGGHQMILTPHYEVIKGTRPSIVMNNDFLKSKVHEELVDILAIGLPMEASDLDFKNVIAQCKGDVDLAIDSYLAEFGIDRKGKQLPTVEKKTKPKADE